jgi:hypothetical protein
MKLYFAYGANMNASDLWYRCPEASLVGYVKLQGYRFIIEEYGVATILKDENHYVQGVLWKINEKDELSLDHYEGVKYGYYIKEYLDIPFYGETLVYISSSKKKGDSRSEYFEKIKRTVENLEFDEEYYNYLKNL